MSLAQMREQVSQKMSQAAAYIKDVYQAGLDAGGYTDGYEAGRKFEHDRFWDVFQQYGNRTNYAWQNTASSGHLHYLYWSMDNFYPKYDIKPTEMYGMFYYWAVGYHPNVTDWDLAKRLKDCGVVLDTSALTALTGIFDRTSFSHLPFVDFTNATACGTTGPFEYCEQLVTIDGIRMAETTPINRYFVRCGELVNVTFEGVIGQNGLNVSWSTKLSHDSLMSIINCLKDYSGTGTTKTVTLGATNLAKLTTAEKAVATQKGWTLA